MNNRKNTYAPPKLPFIYRVVYGSRCIALATLVLLCAFLLQPVHRAFANESEPTDAGVLFLEGVLSDEESIAIPDPDMAEVLSPTTESIPDVSEVTSSADVADTETTDIIEPEPVFGGDATTDIVEPEPISGGDATTTETAATTSDIVFDSEMEELTPSDFAAATTTVDPEATSSDAQPAVFTVESDTHVSFNKDDCTVVSDGSYYCKAAEESALQDRPDGFYSLPDADGDLEIYLQQDTDLRQITHNTVDDASPHFDENSNTLVWHRSVQDRFQIFSLDFETGNETQLTVGDVNNMEPHRTGAYTVWQHWNGNWDIVLHDGKETINVSNNEAQDISPSIRNGLVIWQRTTDEGDRTLELYTIKTGERTTIHDTDGGAISNPRMVVVYESMQANGDVLTKGYDLITGEIISLDQTAPVLPDTIPDPDDIGETRALIQGKTSSREDASEFSDDILSDTPQGTSTLPVIVEGDLVVAGSSATMQLAQPQPILAASTTIADLTLDLRPATTSDESAEFTLVVPVLTEVATSGEVAVP